MLVEILKNQVTPALGCTEPGAVAYAVARAKEIINEDVTKLNIFVDKNILKNGMDVGIPGTKEKGIIFAAALSLVIGKSEYKLEALKDANDDNIQAAYNIIKKNIISLKLKNDTDGLYIEVQAKGKINNSKVIIKNSHLNIVYEDKNGIELLKKNEGIEKNGSKKGTKEIKYNIKNYLINDLIDFSNDVNYENIKFIEDGIKMNRAMANVGMNQDLGIGMGKFMEDEDDNPESLAKALTTAASEARMSGYPLPVMSSAGSGNHGLVAIIPISVIGEKKGLPKEKIIRAVTLSHLVTIYVKTYTGALSPVCGCGVAAGVGCAAGLTYLMGGSKQQIAGAIENMIAGLSGMICDGAKVGCSYKLSIAVSAAMDAAKMALRKIYIPYDNGILDKSVEKTIQNLGRVSGEGMKNTDDVILDVMLKKCN